MPFEILEATAVEGTLGMLRVCPSCRSASPMFALLHLQLEDSPSCKMAAMAVWSCLPEFLLLILSVLSLVLSLFEFLGHLTDSIKFKCPKKGLDGLVATCHR